jgi:hypothetical protein
MTTMQFRPVLEILERRLTPSSVSMEPTDHVASDTAQVAAEIAEPVDDRESLSVRICIDPVAGCRLLNLQFEDLREARVVSIVGGESTRVAPNGFARLTVPEMAHTLELTISDEHGIQVPFLKLDLTRACTDECEQFEVNLTSSQVTVAGLSLLNAHGHSVIGLRNNSASMTAEHIEGIPAAPTSMHSFTLEAMSMVGLMPMVESILGKRLGPNHMRQPNDEVTPPIEPNSEGEGQSHFPLDGATNGIPWQMHSAEVDVPWDESIESLAMDWAGGSIPEDDPPVLLAPIVPTQDSSITTDETGTIAAAIEGKDLVSGWEFEPPKNDLGLREAIMIASASALGAYWFERRAGAINRPDRNWARRCGRASHGVPG